MFPLKSERLSLLDIAKYRSREIEPPASMSELLDLLERAWWLGEIRGSSKTTRLELLTRMFSSLRDRDHPGLVFLGKNDSCETLRQELPDGSLILDRRPRIPVPSVDVNAWDEAGCEAAFQALAQSPSRESCPEMAPVFAIIELTYDEFINWLAQRGWKKPKFWSPPAKEKEQRGSWASHSSGRPQRASGTQQQAAARAIHELWPDGLPIGLKEKDRTKKILEQLQANGSSPVSPRTIQRALKALESE